MLTTDLQWLNDNLDYSKDIFMVIDADSIIFKIAFDKKQTAEDIEQYGDQTLRTLEDVKKQYDEYVDTILKNIRPTHYKLLFTQRSFRYSITSDYKKTRQDKPFEKPKHFDALKEYALGKQDALVASNLEADDLVGIFGYWAKSTEKQMVLVGWDKDLYQVPGIHYNPTKNEIYIINSEEAEYLLWKQVMSGDSTDNISGLKGVGPKKAELFLDNNDPLNWPMAILEEYIKQFGILDGPTKFCENYQLVKLKHESCFGFNPESVNFVKYQINLEEDPLKLID